MAFGAEIHVVRGAILPDVPKAYTAIIFFQCSRKRGHGPEEAFCKQHNPALSDAEKEAVELLKKIADGHNDPRTLAVDFMKKYNNLPEIITTYEEPSDD